MEHAHADKATGLIALVSSVAGGFRFAGKGAYEGATKGLRAAVEYPAIVHEYYYANVIKNEGLTKQLDRLANDSTIIFLSPQEQNDFIKYLAEVSDQELKNALSERFDNYKAYTNTQCPFSKLKLKKHQNPVIVIDDQHNQYICSHSSVKKQMANWTWNEEPALINGNQITQIITEYPNDLKLFVTEVKKRLSVTLAMVTVVGLINDRANAHNTEPLSPRTLSMVQNMKSQGLWKTTLAPFELPANDAVAIDIKEDMNTPLLSSPRQSL